MNQLEYVPGIGGQSVQMDGPTSFVGIAENMRSREWEYSLGYRDLVSATRPAREVDVNFYADYATADDLRRVADADVTARTPGIFIAQKEWRQRGYILASKPSDIHFGRLSTELKVALLDGAWWRLESKLFYTDEPTPDPEYATGTGEVVSASGAAGEPLHGLTVYGKSVQDGTPTTSNPVPIEIVEPASGDSIYIDVDGVQTAINLQGYFLASLPDGTKDELSIDSAGAVTLTKRVGRKTLVGTETWTAYSSWNGNGQYCYYSKISDSPTSAGNTHPPISDFSTSYTQNVFSGSTKPVDACSFDNSRNFCVRVPYSSSSSFKTWLQSNNQNVYYILASEQTISLGSITMPTIANDARISIVAAVTPTITAEWQTSPDLYLDYPHDYQYDYQKTSYTESVTPSVLTPSDVHLVIYGPAVNPYVIVGGNRYQVNVTVPSGGYVIVDGRDKTINLTLADGTVQNVFSSGVRGGGAGDGTYIFEKIPAGTSEVTYDGSFGFDLGWYEEEGEPPWNQS